MKFGINQKLKFDSKFGSYSIVTERENYDSQITATDFETELLIKHFGKKNILIGNVASDRDMAKKKFKKFPNGEDLFLNLVFPKREKTELRLYLSTRAGFKPLTNSVWFIFIRAGDIWIGSMGEAQWRAENSLLVYDDDEQKYQDSIEEFDEVKRIKLKERDVYARDRRLALKRLEKADYKCEFNSGHKLFISRHTNRPYLEAHHLLPMALQETTKTKLDTLSNIFCLCPNCHRAIHHSESSFAREIIDTLVDYRPKVLEILDVRNVDIHRFYALEEIASN
ncbi:MAG: HNH endonuclease [Arenimonas sp.]